MMPCRTNGGGGADVKRSEGRGVGEMIILRQDDKVERD